MQRFVPRTFAVTVAPQQRPPQCIEKLELVRPIFQRYTLNQKAQTLNPIKFARVSLSEHHEVTNAFTDFEVQKNVSGARPVTESATLAGKEDQMRPCKKNRAVASFRSGSLSEHHETASNFTGLEA